MFEDLSVGRLNMEAGSYLMETLPKSVRYSTSSVTV